MCYKTSFHVTSKLANFLSSLPREKAFHFEICGIDHAVPLPLKQNSALWLICFKHLPQWVFGYPQRNGFSIVGGHFAAQ